MSLKQQMKAKLPKPVWRRLKTIRNAVLSRWYRNDLTRLAEVFCTDKWGLHWYTPHYDRYFRELRSRPLNVLEIGVGGYENAEEGGASLRMWKSYFPKSRIVGIDLHDKRHFSEHRIDVRQCDQTDDAALRRLSNEYGGFDIVIDDGSHENEHVIRTFEVMFPLLRQNGIYVVEDVQTAYWSRYGGGMDHPGSSMAFFKKLVDGLNYMEFPIAHYRPSVYDLNIVEIAFFHNLIFVRKGINDEKTNCAEEIQREIEKARP